MRTPVLVISARSDLSDKLAGFEHGADDYMTKPFALAEVEARVRALLNRSSGGSVVDSVLRFGTLELDRERGEARVAGNVVRLTPKAAQLLDLLMRRPGQLVRRTAIEATLWPGAQPPGRRRAQPGALAAPGPGRCRIRRHRDRARRRPAPGRAAGHRRLMARRRSLAERVVWAVTATVALLVGLQSVLAYVTMHEQEDELSDTMLTREVQQIIVHTAQPGLTPTGMLVDSNLVSAWLTRDGVGGESIPAPMMRNLAPGVYHLEPDGRTLHVAVADTDDGRLTVVLDATSAEERVDRFGYTLCALWLGCVVGTIWIARGVAALAVGPFVAATRTIASSAPGQPLAATARSDEAGVLMETFNRFRDSVDDTVAREREFAANLDHEIRTPLTTIRTDAELVGLEADLGQVQRQRLARIIAAVDEIIATTESTLSYSAGRFVGYEAIDLRVFLLHAAAAMSDRAAAKGLRMVVDVVAGEVIEADRQALLTIVRNLLRNAIEHASPATLRIGGDRRAIVFSDDGPGIDGARLDRIFTRAGHVDSAGPRAAAEGRVRGLGLAIAKRLCDLHGWQLEVRSPLGSGHGTAFTLTFAEGTSTSG